jgi:uncharacterized membrane protein
MSKRYVSKEAGVNAADRRKREQLIMKQKRNKLMITSSIILIVIIGMVITYTFFSDPNENRVNNDRKNNSIDSSDIIVGSQIKIPLSDIDTDAKFYRYLVDDVEMRYFALLGSDGDVHVALDACDVCYGAKKGYAQVGDVMRCINCGNQYPVNSLGTENTAGGCWPSYLPIKIAGDNIVIEKSDLEKKIYMF